MIVLVLGGTGATGRLLITELLGRGRQVRAIVRSPDKLPVEVRDHPALSIVHANVLDLSDEQLTAQVTDCSAIASCLGHTMNLRGVYGSPLRLVTDATRRLCEVLSRQRQRQPVRLVLMSSAGVANGDLAEPATVAHRLTVGMIRFLLPPHADNEEAVNHLRTHIGHDATFLEWAAVRPDTLVDEPEVTAYDIHPSPVRDAIFNAGRTSRINVAHFMAELITDDAAWSRWKGRMPVVYNGTAPSAEFATPSPRCGGDAARPVARIGRGIAPITSAKHPVLMQIQQDRLIGR